jgi:urease accessory protein
MKKVLASLTIVAAICLPSLALAHTGHGGAAAGFLHPFTGIDHLFALLALGVFASQLRAGRAMLLVAAFVAVFVAGFFLARAGIEVPAREAMLAASLVGLGALIFLGSRINFWPAMALTALFAVYHGAAHGSEMADLAFGTALPGFLMACLLLTGGSYALGRLLASGGCVAAVRYQAASATISMLTGLLLLA